MFALTRPSITERLLARLDRALGELFAADDAFAARHGWQITDRTRFSRTYRDPRFDTLRSATAHRPSRRRP